MKFGKYEAEKQEDDLMEPIISPWLVYLVGVLTTISHVATVAIMAGSTVIVVCIIVMGLAFNKDEYIWNKSIKIMKITGIVMVVSVLIVTLIPSRNDMLAMFALSYITPDNIQLVQGNIVDFVKQIAQAVK